MGVSPCGDVQQAPDASWPVCRALSFQNSTQEIFEELCDGFDFSPSLVKRQEQQATSSILCRSEVRAGAEGLPAHHPKMFRVALEPRSESEHTPGALTGLSQWSVLRPCS